MQALVPAAGRGSRLRPLTDDRPKALVEVGNRPLLEHVFDALSDYTNEYVVVVGYLGDRIRNHFGGSYRETPITYVEQPERLGLADAVRRAEPAIEGPFVQLNGDNVLSGGVGSVLETHRETQTDATLLVERVSRERAKRGGVVVTDDGQLTALIEKPDNPPSRLATTGCFAFSERIFRAIEAIGPSDRGEYELPDAIGWLIENGGSVKIVRFDGERVNVNTTADIERAERLLDGD